jgi:transcriptional regulator with XRE-family HTH domain
MVIEPVGKDGEKALKKEIGGRFAKFRSAIGKTQTQLARELGVYQSTITNIEVGKVFPRLTYLYYWFQVYHLDFNWLLVGIGEMFVYEEDRTIELLSKLPCHVSRDDPRYQKYLDLIRFMQVPEIEVILMGKLLELKLLARAEIEEFLCKQNRAAAHPVNQLK